MPYIQITHEYDVAGENCFNVYTFWRPSPVPTAAMVEDLRDQFAAVYIPVINSCQTDQVDNVQLIGYAPNLLFSQPASLAGGGGNVVGMDNTIPADIPMVIRENVDSSILNDTGAAYTGNRPVRRGRLFLSGLPKTTMVGTGFDPDGLAVGTWQDMLDILTTPLFSTISSSYWSPVIVGKPLAALPPSPSYPSGKPARADFLVAIILTASASPKGFTNLSTRDG